MDELDSIPLFRGGAQFGSMINSSDFVFSKLCGSSDEFVGPSFPWWFISDMCIMSFAVFVWSAGVIVLLELLTIKTSLREGGETITHGAKISMTISNGDTEVMLGSCAIPVPKSSRSYFLLWCILLATTTYQAGLNPPGGFWIDSPRRAKGPMTTSDGAIEIMLGSCTIRVPKSSSAHNPVLQMVRFGQYLCGVAYPYLYPMVPEYILQSRPSTSRHACEACLDSARHKSESCNAAISEALTMESSGHIKPEHRSVPTDSCDTAEQHCSTLNLEVIVAASRLFASAAPQQATGNCGVLSAGFTPQGGMKKRIVMVNKMYSSNVISTKTMKISVENKYLSQTITSSEHNDEHLGAARALSEHQKEENMLVVKKELAGTKLEHPSEPDTGRTIEAEERKAAATWLIATAAPHHATGNRSLLSGFTPEDGHFVEAGDGSPMQALGRGSVVTDTVVLPDVWFVPGLTGNLVSVSKLVELDYSVGFARAACYIRSAADGAVIGKAHAGEDGMFELDFLRVPPPAF